VLTGLDLPRVKFGILPVSQDEEALCTEKVRMVGDAVAAVAAVDEETAERATELIDVEYEVLPALMSIEAALRRPEVRIHEYGDGPNVHKAVSLEFGDVESASPAPTSCARMSSTSRANTPSADGAALRARPLGARRQADALVVDADSHYVHRLLGPILDVPLAHIRVIATPNGGGFGGKLDPFAHEIAACKLSQVTGRPVKINADARGSLLRPPGPPSRPDVGADRRHPAGRDPRDALPDLARRRRYGSYGVASTFYTGALQTVTYRVPGVQVRGGPDLHQQAALRA